MNQYRVDGVAAVQKIREHAEDVSIVFITSSPNFHGLIHNYYLSKLGKAVITTGLKTKAPFIISNLAGIEVSAV